MLLQRQEDVHCLHPVDILCLHPEDILCFQPEGILCLHPEDIHRFFLMLHCVCGSDLSQPWFFLDLLFTRSSDSVFFKMTSDMYPSMHFTEQAAMM